MILPVSPRTRAHAFRVTRKFGHPDICLGERPFKIACVGGGPAGLYFAISMKLRDPTHQIEIFERNAPGVTFGWGVVFSDSPSTTSRATTRKAPEPSTRNFAHWDDIDVHIRGETITSVRSRLHRHRPQAPAGNPAGPRARTGRDPPIPSRVRSGRREMARAMISSSRPTAPTRRFRDADAGSVRCRDIDVPPTVRLARYVRRPSTPSLRLRGNGARLDLGPRLPVRARPLDLHRRMSEESWRDFGFDTMSQDESIAACETTVRQVSRRPFAGNQRLAPRRLALLAELPPHQVQRAGRAAI